MQDPLLVIFRILKISLSKWRPVDMFVITMATDRNSLSGFQQGLVLIGLHQNPPSLCGEMTACTVREIHSTV